MKQMPINNRSGMLGARLLVAGVLMICCHAAKAEMRVWEDVSGKAVKAEFVRELFGAVELRRTDGSLYSIPLEQLSAQDTKYLRTRIPPDISMTIRTQKKPKERNENATRSEFTQYSDEIDVVTASIEVRQKSEAVFSGTLRAEIYLIGQEVATDDYRLSGKESVLIRFTEENRRKYSFQAAADFRVYEEYNDLETRGADYAGYLVVVIGPMGNKLAVQTDLPWLEEEGKVDALRAFHVDSFFDENIRKRSVPRPRYFDARFEF